MHLFLGNRGTQLIVSGECSHLMQACVLLLVFTHTYFNDIQYRNLHFSYNLPKGSGFVSFLDTMKCQPSLSLLGREMFWGTGIYCIIYWAPCQPKVWSYDPRQTFLFVSISILNLWHKQLKLWIGTVIIFNLEKKCKLMSLSFLCVGEKIEKNIG